MSNNFVSMIYKQFLKPDRAIDADEEIKFRKEQNTGFVYFTYEPLKAEGMILDSANLVRICYTLTEKHSFYYRALKISEDKWKIEHIHIQDNGIYYYRAIERTIASKDDLFNNSPNDKNIFVDFSKVLGEDDYSIINGTRCENHKIKRMNK